MHAFDAAQRDVVGAVEVVRRTRAEPGAAGRVAAAFHTGQVGVVALREIEHDEIVALAAELRDFCARLYRDDLTS